jgi:hypothetical protein
VAHHSEEIGPGDAGALGGPQAAPQPREPECRAL